MLTIIKNKTEFNEISYYNFNIIDGDTILNIHFAGNLDLYWNIYDKDSKNESNSFVITKENYFLYSLFEDLFVDIETLELFDNSDFELFYCENEEERQEVILRNKYFIERYKKSQEYKNLFHDGIIEWHSDDFPYDKASIVTIKKENDLFIITFQKSKEYERTSANTSAIRFRNARSGYAPFNVIFMKMYNKFIEYEPEYHQIHIEEFLYQEKLKKKYKN